MSIAKKRIAIMRLAGLLAVGAVTTVAAVDTTPAYALVKVE